MQNIIECTKEANGFSRTAIPDKINADGGSPLYNYNYMYMYFWRVLRGVTVHHPAVCSAGGRKEFRIEQSLISARCRRWSPSDFYLGGGGGGLGRTRRYGKTIQYHAVYLLEALGNRFRICVSAGTCGESSVGYRHRQMQEARPNRWVTVVYREETVLWL